MEKMKSNYLETNDRKTCYGCNACEYICPTNAITMNEKPNPPAMLG